MKTQTLEIAVEAMTERFRSLIEGGTFEEDWSRTADLATAIEEVDQELRERATIETETRELAIPRGKDPGQ